MIDRWVPPNLCRDNALATSHFFVMTPQFVALVDWPTDAQQRPRRARSTDFVVLRLLGALYHPSTPIMGVGGESAE